MNEKNYIEILSETELLEKAANASSEGITISTMTQPDRPLIFVNEGFKKLTGYSSQDAIGKNCRFLQGEDTNQKSVAKLREAIKKGEACTVELLNYTKTGDPFWNRLSITPILNQDGIVTHYVGIQSDITDLRKTQVELRLANKELKTFQERIKKELDQAKIVQHLLLPTKFPQHDDVRFASLFIPMDEVGGDFFDVIELSDDKYGILIADVTGHGIPAALLTFMLSTVFKNAAAGLTSTEQAVRLTNKRLYGNMPGDAFVTMFYAIYDTSSGILTYTQAGHPEGYIVRKSTQEIIPLSTEGTLVGAFSDDEVSFSQKEIQLQSGDKLCLYTDAILDILDKVDDDEVDHDFESLLLRNSMRSLEQLFNAIYEFGLECGNLKKYPDDFTIVGLEVIEK
ncbi:MAG: SpoIIE family protein phosphatase [Saprospiraceae bacterium]|nr:SpoIIE family protein phosphatase [Saprospiraceae bacterium]